MATEVSIINSALRKLGDRRITSRTDSDEAAVIANDLFDELRDALLRTHPWNFAVTRLKLAQSATAPVSQYDHQYPLPGDWLRTLKVSNNEACEGTIDYRVESHATVGLVVLTDADEVWLRYVRRVTDVNVMATDFREVLAYRLAADMALAVANSGTLRDRMDAAYVSALRRARATDSIEDFPEPMPEGSWVTARRGGSTRGRWPDVLES